MSKGPGLNKCMNFRKMTDLTHYSVTRECYFLQWKSINRFMSVAKKLFSYKPDIRYTIEKCMKVQCNKLDNTFHLNSHSYWVLRRTPRY